VTGDLSSSSDLSTFAVTVYLAASRSVPQKYFDLAHAVGAAIAEEKWLLVYGGNDVGPMGALANGARSRGGKVIGITPHCFNDGGLADKQCHELIFVQNMRERKMLLETRGHAFVALPGGIGTLEEFFEILVGRLLKFHDKPILLVNLDGFWDPMLEMLRRYEAEGFVRPSTFAQFDVVGSVEEAMVRLRQLLPCQARAAAEPI
jgi:uncharacterized protein (TIGR00730 family)